MLGQAVQVSSSSVKKNAILLMLQVRRETFTIGRSELHPQPSRWTTVATSSQRGMFSSA
jgi:hypothetical protein